MTTFTPSLKQGLQNEFSEIVTTDVCMATLSHWRIGGRAAALIRPRSESELARVCAWSKLHQIPSVIIGNTTNLLFADEDINAIIIQLSNNFSDVHVDGTNVIAKSGVYIPSLARITQRYGLYGLEHVIGIPGTLGGLVVMNGGSQRKAIGQAISYVNAMDPMGKVKRFSSRECDFAYRSSIFQESKLIITEVGLSLEFAEDKSMVHAEMLKILKQRSKKFPRRLPNCGSVFVSSTLTYERYGPPGKIIEDCGLKGISRGGAQISPIHANFIVNNGKATANDVLWLISHVRKVCYDKIGHVMQAEAKYVDSGGNVLAI